jgi:bifunctional non-homologous end joining protein LigD
MDLSKYLGEGGATPRENLKREKEPPGNRFVIQEHQADRFHFDFRLEIKNSDNQTQNLHSWIIPKNIPLDMESRHLAIKVDNKHLSYLTLDQKIVGGDYGKGELKIWDKGKWGLMKGSVEDDYFSFNLFGKIVKARYIMEKIKNEKQKNHWIVWRSKIY